MRSGRCLRVLSGHRNLVRTLQFNREFLVSGSYDETIIIWDLRSGEILHQLQSHQNRIFKVQFSETLLLSCSPDQTILWDFCGDVRNKLFY